LDAFIHQFFICTAVLWIFYFGLVCLPASASVLFSQEKFRKLSRFCGSIKSYIQMLGLMLRGVLAYNAQRPRMDF
jgi:hypothetical protein